MLNAPYTIPNVKLSPSSFDVSLILFLLQSFSEHALGLVVSTPDRDRMAKVYNHPGSHRGPPANLAHVREWLDRELELMFLDNGMFPLYSGQECGFLGYCKRGFTVRNTSLSNQIHIIGNTKVNK